MIVTGARGCVYCLGNAILRPDQILVRSRSSYVVAPRGQLAGGFLAAAPYSCVSSLSRLEPDTLRDLALQLSLIVDFYRNEGHESVTLYEQGRGGAGATRDPKDGFPLHAHLCAVAGSVNLDARLRTEGVIVELAKLAELPLAVKGRAYVLAVTSEPSGVRLRAYVASNPEQARQLESLRLRVWIAGELGSPRRAHWRNEPADDELESLVGRFRDYLATS